MFFGRKNPFSATDAFPLSDAVMEFDDSSSAMVRPARRALDGMGPRSGRSAREKWLLAAGLMGLYALAMLGFCALGMVDLQVLAVLGVLVLVLALLAARRRRCQRGSPSLIASPPWRGRTCRRQLEPRR